MSNDPLEYFEKNVYSVNLEQLKSIYENAPISENFLRFMNCLENFIFGILAPEGKNGIELHLLYAEYQKELVSFILPVPIDNFTFADDITAVLAGKIVNFNPDKDFFNVYNTFQYHRQNALEALNYFTFDPQTTPEGTLISVGRKLAPVRKLDRVDCLRTLYGNVVDKPHLDPENKIYLMVDNSNGYIKIGKSKNPKYREGTLQSKKPETHLISIWTAPASIEKELHKKYASKRKRGEWFQLSFKDLDEIKEYMDSL